MALTDEEYIMYRKGMTQLTARELISNINATCAPHIKESARGRMINGLTKIAEPLEVRAMTHEDMARFLNG